MANKDLVFRFLGIDGGAGREFDRMAGKSAALEHAVGKLTLGFAAAGVAIGVESVKAAAKFQQSMELIRTQAGASQREVDKMSKAVLALAGPTATAPQTLTEGLYHLESAGFRGAKALAALKTAAEGAKIGGANLEDVTNALNATLVSSSIEMWLSSQSSRRLPSRWVPASELASAEMPSSRSPSEAMQ